MPTRRLPALNALRAFEAVARYQSFKDAAEELCVTPGALSQQVRKLEDDLDLPLLVRHNRAIEVTHRGRSLGAGLTDAFARMRQAVEVVRSPDQAPRLTVVCPPAFAAKWLVPRLARFTSAHPDVEIAIVTNRRSVNEPVDLMISLGQGPAGEPGVKRLARESFVPLVAPALLERHGAQQPEDLRQLPLIAETPGAWASPTPTWSDWFDKLALAAPEAGPVLNFGDRVEQAIDAAVAGVGAFLGPRLLASHELESGRLVAPWKDVAVDAWYQVERCDGAADAIAVSAFSDWLNEEFRPTRNDPSPVLRAVGA